MGLGAGGDLAAFIATLNSRGSACRRACRQMGVPRQVLPAMAAAALADHSTATNPRPLGQDDFARLLAESF